ncbi:MAG: hypothetical protein HOY71_29510, partial [Nonomuraea sp.]|nr:hypothetical protein [Nonomuraea sp.]
LGQAAPTGPNGERAPLTISGDGHRLVYLDRDTRRLVLHDLTHESDPRPITEPLTAAAPDPVFAQDGMSVVLTWPDGVEIVDVATAARTRPTGVGQVLGVGTYGMVATTGRRALPGAPDTVLLTLDRQGSVLTRVPFDPTVRAALTPDGRHLVTLSDGQVVTMDPRTGAVTRHARLTRLPEYYGTPSLTGWSGDGRLVVAIHPDDPGDAAFHLVDPVTGRAGQLKDAPDELDDVVLGRLP